jgi:uncharacterized protein (TIGR02145 family)
MKMKNLILILVFLATCISCKKDDITTIPTSQTVTDIDGNVYHTVVIGTQTWMVENLKTTKYRNGNPIVSTSIDYAWANDYPAYCWYYNDSTYGNHYGALYNWHAVNTGLLCPIGWHIPTITEWTTLINYLGGEEVSCDKLKEAGQNHWLNNLSATNESGFTALPGSFRSIAGGFCGVGSEGYWWSSTESDNLNAWYIKVSDKVNIYTSLDNNKHLGYSIRCIKD